MPQKFFSHLQGITQRNVMMSIHVDANHICGLKGPDTNEATIVSRADYGSTDIHFNGDISTTIESVLMVWITSVAAGI